MPLTVRGAAAVMPELAEGGPEAIESLSAALTARVAPMLEQYRDGDALAFPMVTNLVLATPQPRLSRRLGRRPAQQQQIDDRIC